MLFTTETAVYIYQQLAQGEAPLGYRMFSPEQNDLFLELSAHLRRTLGDKYDKSPKLEAEIDKFLKARS
ncbi:MAG TPA: hypothetical protein V6D13_17770 [Halomicronema sp.]